MYFLSLLISLFLVQPVVEYWLHRLAHRLLWSYHTEHHTHTSKGQYWTYSGDWGVRGMALCLALMGWYTAAIMLLRHDLMHTVSHRFAGLRYLHRHHFLHHLNRQYNFSFSAIWPDWMFGTLQQ